jgi:hypothetical protein
MLSRHFFFFFLAIPPLFSPVPRPPGPARFKGSALRLPFTSGFLLDSKYFLASSNFYALRAASASLSFLFSAATNCFSDSGLALGLT